VVANEVKELAKESAKATEDISRKIESIQLDTKDSVEAIGTISGIINQISDISATVASAGEEQNATTNEMSRNVTRFRRNHQEYLRGGGSGAKHLARRGRFAEGSARASENVWRTEGPDGHVQVLTRTSTHRLARRYRSVLCRATVLPATGLVQLFAGEVEEGAG